MGFNSSRRQFLKDVGAATTIGIASQSASASGHHAYWEPPSDCVSTAKSQYFGDYATTIPSKFISSDGTSMWVQSNWFENVLCGATTYNFNLRTFDISLRTGAGPTNCYSDTDNLATKAGVTPKEKTPHYGHDEFYNNGNLNQSEDSWDGTAKNWDFWGYTWPREYSVNRIEYTTGDMFSDGGWFTNASQALPVQVRQNFDWVDVAGLVDHDGYPYDSTAGPNNTYTFTFEGTYGDGVRIIGEPGGTENFTSIAELEVYFSSSGGGAGPVTDGTYKITNANSGKVLEVAGGEDATSDGDNIQQRGWWGGDNQKWNVTDTGGSVYKVEAVHSGKLMDVSGDYDGANVHQWGDWGGDNQRFYIYEDGYGNYLMEATHSHQFVEVAGAGTNDGDNVHQWSHNGSLCQRWNFDLL